MVIGRTGDGKSTLCHVMALRLGLPSEDMKIFKSSSGVSSHTHDPETWTSKNIRLMDTPGLMDTGGVVQDEDNIAKIVQHVSALGYVNGFILVVNEQAPRFDAGMQDAVKLLVDSFGPSCLSNMGIAYTRAYGMVAPDESKQHTIEYSKMISTRIGIPIYHLASWQVGCKPEELRKISPKLTEDDIREGIMKRDNTLDEIIRWARAKNPVDTTGAVIGEYEQRKRVREEEDKRKEADAQRIYDNSVISSDAETKTEEYKRTSVPIMHNVERSETKRRGGVEGLFGATKTNHWTESVHVGNRVTLHMREVKRSVDTLGSGKKIYGEWTTVREWEDQVN